MASTILVLFCKAGHKDLIKDSERQMQRNPDSFCHGFASEMAIRQH